METKALSQYIRIAAILAERIANEEVPVGSKLPGLSVLATRYNVSPETVRKAISLLADMHILSVREGSGSFVVSKEAAKAYLETISVRKEQIDLSNRLQDLYKEYKNLGKEMINITSRLVSASASPLPSEKALPNYEVVIPADSDKIGLTIGELRFWQCTGATIVAVKRGQNITISPGPYSELHGGDVLVYVGAPSCKETVEHLFHRGSTPNRLYNIQEQIFQAIHAKELVVIAEALGAKLGDLSDFEPMVKGMTNRSFLFTCKGIRYILRIPGEGTHSLVNRKDEAAVYQAISGTGLCDDAAYINPENGLKVTRFLEQVRNCDPYNQRDLEQAMDLLRRFHNMHLQVDHTFSITEHIDYYESLADPIAHMYPDYEQTKEAVLSLVDFVDAHRETLCLTHIDAVPDNFLFHVRDGKEQLQLTDWEYAGMQDPHVDIAMFCIYSEYDREQIDNVIDLYFEGNCDADTRTKIYCYVALCGLLWSNWCAYKRTFGVDFSDYAQNQYQYAKTYSALAAKRLTEGPV